MSRRPSKHANTSAFRVSTSWRGGRRSQPAAPVEEEMERIDPDVDEVPECRFDFRVVPARARR